MKILDVGCGKIGKGDVNIDLFVGETPHSDVDFIKPKKIKNFIKADAFYLPFRDNSFSLVHASHVLEHLPEPLKALSEFKRVSNEVVVIKVPHANFYRGEEFREHIFSWNRYSLKNLVQKCFTHVKIETTWREESISKCGLNPLKRKLLTLKFMVFSLFWGRNELTAICK